VRLSANTPREHYSNFVARDLASHGYLNLAEIAEAGHGCAYCHIVKNYSNLSEANANVDLRHYNAVATFLHEANIQFATIALTTIGGAALTPMRAPALAADAEAAMADTEITIAEGASAPKVAPNQSNVPLPTPGENPMAYGTRVHQELPRIVGETNPGATGTYNVRPGLTGADLANPNGMNATFGEMKSLWDQQSRILSQARRWGFDPQTGRYFFYDRNTGRVFEGIIQTEKFPSGRFRP